MKITVITMVKNEEDILEAFVRHTLHYADHLLVLENGSIDSTPQILQRLHSEGLPLEIKSDTTFRYNQSEKTTQLYQQAITKRPDFVIPLDADEFIQTPSVEVFRQELEKIPHSGVGTWGWRTCLPTHQDSAHIPTRFSLARKNENTNHKKVVIRGIGSTDSRLVISQGNHSVKRSNRNPPAVELERSYLAHLPIRSIQQLAQKVILGWMANVAQYKTTSPVCGYHWGELYRRVLSLNATDLMREAYNYSERHSTTDLDLAKSGLVIEGGCTTLYGPITAELDRDLLLARVCSSWEAQLLRT